MLSAYSYFRVWRGWFAEEADGHLRNHCYRCNLLREFVLRRRMGSPLGDMLGPEPPGANPRVDASRFWNLDYAGPGKNFSVGNVVHSEANDALPDFLFPHATEDRIVGMGTPLPLYH